MQLFYICKASLYYFVWLFYNLLLMFLLRQILFDHRIETYTLDHLEKTKAAEKISTA